MNLSGIGKFGAIVIVFILGLDLSSKWTGEPYALDLLHPNQIGRAITGGA